MESLLLSNPPYHTIDPLDLFGAAKKASRCTGRLAEIFGRLSVFLERDQVGVRGAESNTKL
jgi:hypothetical protein